MITQNSKRKTLSIGVMLALCAGLLAACASAEKEGGKGTAPGAKKAFPNLATVPDKKPGVTPARDRATIQEGLFADRKNARHVDGPVAGYGDPARRVVPRSKVPARVVSPGSGRVAARAVRRTPTVDNVAITTNGLLTRVTFPAGATALPPGSGTRIVRVFQIQQLTKGKITVIGRSLTSEGNAAQRRAISIARARAIANGLVALGVPASVVRVTAGKGNVRSADVFISGGKAPRRQ